MATKPITPSMTCPSCAAHIRNKLFPAGTLPKPSACTTCRRCRTCGCCCTRCMSCTTQIPRTPSRFCETCRTCRSCCGCRRMPHFVRLKPTPNERYHVNTLHRTLGMELELSDWGHLRDDGIFRHMKYTVAHDWSVKPSEQEMVINPLQGDGLLRGLYELAEQCYQHKAQVNESCAYHVHVGGSDLSYWDLRKILRVYEHIEPEIYNHLILPHRRDVPEVTHYCQMLTQPHREPCQRCTRFDQQYPGQRKPLMPLSHVVECMNASKTTGELKQVIIKMLYGNMKVKGREAAQDLQTRKGGRYEWARYVGLNLHAWMYRGTVEFRMKEASTDLMELLAWPLWCGWFIEGCTRMNDRRTARGHFDLLQFTDEFMPPWITAWVAGKISNKSKSKMDPVPIGGNRIGEDNFPTRATRRWVEAAPPLYRPLTLGGPGDQAEAPQGPGAIGQVITQNQYAMPQPTFNTAELRLRERLQQQYNRQQTNTEEGQ